jgi:hypothetical protein
VLAMAEMGCVYLYFIEKWAIAMQKKEQALKFVWNVYWRCNVVLLVWPGSKSQSKPWKNISISKSQEILHDEITCENSAYYFLWYLGFIHCKFISQDQTVNRAYCIEILIRLHLATSIKMSTSAQQLVLHHNNTPAHQLLSFKAVYGIKTHSWTGMPSRLTNFGFEWL